MWLPCDLQKLIAAINTIKKLSILQPFDKLDVNNLLMAVSYKQSPF